MHLESFIHLADDELIAHTKLAVVHERRTTVELVALLGELDARKLYLGEGCSSLFTYCTHVLHLSEAAAYGRITAARLARRFPVVLTQLVEGAITLTTVSLLSAHLTDENHDTVLDAARHKCKREIEQLVANLSHQPDVPSSVRRLPMARAPIATPLIATPQDMPPPLAAAAPQPAPRRAVIAPLAPSRYLIKVTVSAETHDKLARARDLLRHVIPDGDAAAILDRALTLLVHDLERTRLAITRRNPATPGHSGRRSSRSRQVPAGVRRAVWTRDEGRCAFVGREGRCRETGRLELHHVVPYSAGGATGVENLQLRCRAHNAFEASQYFGDAANGR